MTDDIYMQRALELGRKGMGHTSPNPPVGAVVVKGRKIIGEGYHKKAGTPHAEVHALRKAGKRAAGATLYVTLEPCCHFGRTPPCTDAIIQAGIKRVVVGAIDPNPIVNRKGIKTLCAAGIEVKTKVLEKQCRDLIRHYAHFMQTGMPYVTCKVALSLDGKLATATGESKWITGPKARRFAHDLRAKCDAILIGKSTARLDDPRLTVRLGAKEKIKHAVIVDSAFDVPLRLHVFDRGDVTLATTNRTSADKMQLAQAKGMDVLCLPQDKNGRVDLIELMKALGQKGITSLLVEGGGELIAGLVKLKLIQRFAVAIAPIFIGGCGRDVLPGLNLKTLAEALRLKDVEVKRFGDDVVMEGEVVCSLGL
ncbi:MAG: bifunctional diaminohydroxyphosphoribosylaminopyrimidine deaminase/5-amino-6-(5-phosphoribosylamino)uracil reductase RibD [Deltaproteobacteria bacterium]|nr:bifunctional diaminohydroxyphosphoribosylaminopyrimidine deaminase/5-amino-6-(5-phosphoribosylamino)uracil reductase RibD [Deltaproteobacteria bacterium]